MLLSGQGGVIWSGFDEDSIVFNFDLWAYSFYLVSNLTYSAYGHLYLVI